MLKSGSDMMAAAESEVHSLEELEVLKYINPPFCKNSNHGRENY